MIQSVCQLEQPSGPAYARCVGRVAKLLVANRGEIAIRVFRAAYELGIATVAVYTWADRQSLHRSKADEAYQIGGDDLPLKPYLDPGAIVDAALQAGADAVHPGYGFLSENPALADACAEAGITFVGPPTEVLRLCGNKMRAQAAAAEAGLPVLDQSGEVTPDSALAAAERIGVPLFVKAAAGGGGRGLRRVDDPADLPGAVETARSEAASAFGDPTVFLEQAVDDPRHIEVQLLGDRKEVIHLYERDCSVQRRHQKVIELAPAPNLDPGVRDAVCAAAVRLGRAIGYANAGTAEFLVDGDGRFVFIELNPRIQVEHTVTEETTDVDIVQAQIRLAAGASLADLGLTQDRIVQRGAALQCRITTEDPANGFRPDTGRILAYREPGGAGIRLDGGGGYQGAEVTPFFDSLLTKLTCRGRTFDDAAARARRALAEFRVRGPATNISFLTALLADPDFLAGNATTGFIADHPELVAAEPGADRATKLLAWLADVTVNQPHGAAPAGPDPADKLDDLPTDPPPDGSRQRLDQLGADAFAAWMRDQPQLLVTDTTLRDAHQSILATRLRTADLVAGARHLAHHTPGLLSVECWGGATYDAALRFLHEDPWERLDRIRTALPNVCLQMLLRGRNTVGYTAYPEVVTRRFVAEARRSGIDVFRVFDALNAVEAMRPALDAVREHGGLAEGTICYSGDLTDPAEDLYTLDYYLGVAEGLVAAGAQVLCVKDMAGLLRAPAARRLIAALRSAFDTPVHLHTHDTAGGQLATYIVAVDAGVDAVDGATAPLAGMTSQPALPAIAAAFAHTDADPCLPVEGLAALEPYWEAVRRLYAPFEAGLAAPTGRVYDHEIPGGQLSNLRTQADAVGLGGRFEQIEALYADCDRLLGRPIKVTPTSKVVGDLALGLAAAGRTAAELAADPGSVDLPDSVVGFLHGELGTPPGGFPEPFRTRALDGRRPAAPPTPLEEADLAVLEDTATVRPTLNRLLFPQPATDYADHAQRYGDLSRLPTRLFLYGLEAGDADRQIILEPGVSLLVGLDAVGEPDPKGMRRVVCRLNGQLRPIDARDRSIDSAVATAEQADPADPGQVAAPFTGVVSLQVAAGDPVSAGQPVAVIEAMKMESVISAPTGGVVQRLAGPEVRSVEPGDLLCVISPDQSGAETS